MNTDTPYQWTREYVDGLIARPTNNEKQEFIDFVVNTFEELKSQFVEKQTQYGTADPLANFRRGAMLQNGDQSLESMFDIALAYENKHVSHVYNHGICGNKVDESLKDIAIYSVIELYMINKYKNSEKK